MTGPNTNSVYTNLKYEFCPLSPGPAKCPRFVKLSENGTTVYCEKAADKPMVPYIIDKPYAMFAETVWCDMIGKYLASGWTI